jgi:hypothetical protein
LAVVFSVVFAILLGNGCGGADSTTTPTRGASGKSSRVAPGDSTQAGAVTPAAPLASGPATRQAKVAARGARIMPFDLERTTHTFEPLDGGGLQTVVADDPADEEQIRLIREHLSEEADRFGRGDFSDPAGVHGEEMPGLGTLRSGARRIELRYDEIPAGARILHSTDEPELLAALHAWFAAQVSDHGAHARR